MPEINDVLEQIMYIVITAILPIALTFIKSYLNIKASEAIANIENENIAKYLSYATDAIGVAVDSVSQTYVDTLKAEGKFDDVAQEKAKIRAMETARHLISTEAKKVIESIYGDLDSYLDASIEAYIKSSKLV